MQHDSLKKPSEFSTVYKKGKSYADRNLVLYVLPSKNEVSHLGISISKKVGKSVVRNRIRRLIKEVYRNEIHFDKTYDLIVIARVNSANIGYQDVKKSMRYLIRKADVK